jgi:hypothetical protein
VIRDRLAELREDLGWGLRRTAQRLRRGGPGLSARGRRQVALVVLVLAVYGVFRFVAVPGVPCDASPAKACVATDHAIDLVPAGSYLYLHLNLDRETDQFSQAQDLAGKLPHFDAIAQGSSQALGLPPAVNLRRDVDSWIGDEAAFAQVAAGAGAPRSLTLLAIRDAAGAERLLARLGRGKPHFASYRGTGLRTYRHGLAAAELDGFLALGSVGAVKAAIDTWRGKAESLAGSEPAGAIRDSLPHNRLADVYVSADGIKRLLAGRGGLTSQLDTFTDFGASRGIAAALVAHHDGLELQLDSALDATKVKVTPSFFQAFPSFDPSLAPQFAPDTLLYLGLANPGATVRALLDQASGAAPGIVAAFDRFERQVRRGGVDIEKGVLPVLSGEAAAGVVSASPVPYLSLVFADVDEDRARLQMARLQAPIIAALRPGRTGQAPTFEARKIGDTVMRAVRITPVLYLAYAIFDGKLVVSTNPAGVRQAVEGNEDLGDSDAFRAVTSAASSRVSALVFLNLEGLVRRAEPLGLGRIVRGFGEDVSKLRALGLSVQSVEDTLKTTLFLSIE